MHENCGTQRPTINEVLNTEENLKAACNVAGVGGSCRIESQYLRHKQMILHKRLSEIEYEKSQLLQALKDLEDPAVQKVLRIMSLA